jgi:hypothetical protein
MSKYYKSKEKLEYTSEQKEKRKKLFFDKRVRSIVNCAECDDPITLKESKRNGGVCDNCAR